MKEFLHFFGQQSYIHKMSPFLSHSHLMNEVFFSLFASLLHTFLYFLVSHVLIGTLMDFGS